MARIFLLMTCLVSASFGDMSSCAHIRRIEISGIQEGPIYSGAVHRYTNYTAGPNGWMFLRYFCFLDFDGQPVRRTGLAVELEGKDYWLSSEKPPQYYPCNPVRMKIPKKIRTRDDGFAVYSAFEPRAVPVPNTPYSYSYLGQVKAKAKTYETMMEFVVSERSALPEPKPYWYLYKDGEWGFWYGSGATIGCGFRTFADYPPVKPGTPPPPYDFGKGQPADQPACASFRPALTEQKDSIACPEEQAFLDGFGQPTILWCRLHYISDPNLPNSNTYCLQPVQDFIPFENWTDPNEIAQQAELIQPVFLADSASCCFAVLKVSIQPNEPNQTYPFLLEKKGQNGNRFVYRPNRLFFTVADANEPFWLTEPQTGWPIFVIPERAGEISVDFLDNSLLDLVLSYSERWLTDYPPFDLDRDGKVNYQDF